MKNTKIHLSIELLGNHKEFVLSIAEYRWKEWGKPPDPTKLEEWVEITSKETGLDQLPITWVAIIDGRKAVGAIGLAEYDIPERQDRTPWIIGTIVMKEYRGSGIGGKILANIEEWAKRNKHETLWVATGGKAVGFYEKYGWKKSEQLIRSNGEYTEILKKEL